MGNVFVRDVVVVAAVDVGAVAGPHLMKRAVVYVGIVVVLIVVGVVRIVVLAVVSGTVGLVGGLRWLSVCWERG